jgi:hypothetical protein
VTDATPTDQLWPSDNGFFFEISKGAICAGNVFVNCDHGVMVLNASDVKIEQNTFVNSMACIGRNARSAQGDHFGWHASTGPDVDRRDGHTFVNNLLVGDREFTRPLMFVWQPAGLCEKLQKPMLAELDHNAYVRQIAEARYPLMLWSPAQNRACQMEIRTLDDLRKVLPQFEAAGGFYSGYDGPLFKSMDLGDYTTVPTFPGTKSGKQLPAEIGTLMGLAPESGSFVGAYPPAR